MDALHAAWSAFVDKAGLSDEIGGKPGSEFIGLGPMKAGETGPRDVPVGSFVFFPSEPREDIEFDDEAFLVAQSETRALVADENGKLKEVHFGGAHLVPLSLAEALALAVPFVGITFEEVGETRFLSPGTEAAMREDLGGSFDTASDLFGVPLLPGARAELAARIQGSQVLMGVAVCLLLGIVLIATAMPNVAMKLAVLFMLGCIPVTLIVMGLRSRAKAREELLRLPS